MKLFKSPVFILCSLLFIIHQVMQKGLDIHFVPADSYLDNFVAMPIILTLLLAERRWLFKKGHNYRLTVAEISIATIYISFLTEIFFPLFSESFRGDWIDVLMYALGSCLFYFTINKIPGENPGHHVPQEEGFLRGKG